jgi:hypothetical protein
MKKTLLFLLTFTGLLLSAAEIQVAIGDKKVLFDSVGGGIRDIFTGLFAGGAYILPVFMILRSVLWNRDTEEGQFTGRSICLALEFLFITMFLHVVGGGQHVLGLKEHFADGTELVGGGVFGGLLGELLLRGFGTVCTVIIVL